MGALKIKQTDERKGGKRKNKRINMKMTTLINKAYELGEFDGINVVLAICKYGQYTSYRSKDHASWPPFIAEIVTRLLA
jgi:hypothetical protein